MTHTITEVAGGPKLVNLTFNLDEGPRVKVRKVDFVANKAASDGKLEGQMKSNKSEWMWSFITGRGTYQAAKFEEHADLILEYYRNEGYVMARVGQPFGTDKPIEELKKRGFYRAWFNGEVAELNSSLVIRHSSLDIVVERLVIEDDPRLSDSIEIAWREGQGKMKVIIVSEQVPWNAVSHQKTHVKNVT